MVSIAASPSLGIAGAGGDDMARGGGRVVASVGTQEGGVNGATTGASARDSPSDDGALGEDIGVG